MIEFLIVVALFLVTVGGVLLVKTAREIAKEENPFDLPNKKADPGA